MRVLLYVSYRLWYHSHWYMVMGIEDNAEILTMRTRLNSCCFTNVPY